VKVERGTHKKKQSSSNPGPVLPGWMDFQQKTVAQSGERTSAMEDESIIR
jgi:hypothetical protein